MRYEKPVAEVVKFDFAEFMTASLSGGVCSTYTDEVGHTCGAYTAGSSCSNWSTPSWSGSCGNYDGKKCYGYTDSTHPNCREYGISCSKF